MADRFLFPISEAECDGGDNEHAKVAARSTQDQPVDNAANVDLETVLSAWHGATIRLEETHSTLRLEVERLRGELEWERYC